MTIPEKRKISAQRLLEDIRSGMGAEQLKQKHGLSDRSLESAFRKLAAAGLVTEAEIKSFALSPPRLQEAPQQDNQTATLQKCPACGAPLKSNSPECPSCGVVVAKFVTRREQGSPADLPQPEKLHMRKRWLFGFSLAAVAVVAGVFLFFWLKDKYQVNPAVVEGSGRPPAPGKALKQPGVAAGTPVERGRKERQAQKVSNIFDLNAGELFELRFVPEGFPLGLSVSQGSGGEHFFETPDPNQGFKKFPPETGAKRYYDQCHIGGQTFLMLTEASNPPKIYLDANRNGDMTDDPGPFVGEGPTAAPNHYVLELPYKGEKTSVPYRLWLFASNMGGMRFYPKCHWEGRIELNGNLYKMVAFDGNADGDYSNDPLIIDVDNDGKASDAERLRPGQSLTIDGVEVKLLAIAPSGRWVRLEH